MSKQVGMEPSHSGLDSQPVHDQSHSIARHTGSINSQKEAVLSPIDRKWAKMMVIANQDSSSAIAEWDDPLLSPLTHYFESTFLQLDVLHLEFGQLAPTKAGV